MCRFSQFQTCLSTPCLTANSNSIVVGVKHHPNGDRDILGIEEFIDDASYYQLVHSNIEPDIHFEYSYLPIDNKKVGVFRVFNCDNPPYMIKKDGRTLKKGDSYIRKGTSQMKLMRADIDRIFARRQTTPDLAAKIDVVCEIDGELGVSMTPKVETGLPSASEARYIRRVIADKEKTEAEREAQRQAMVDKNVPLNPLFNSFLNNPLFAQMNAAAAIASGRGLPYEKRDLATLKDDLKAIKKTYREDDLYYMYEERTHKINFFLLNQGEQYVEDCTVEIQFKKSFPFVVAPTIYRKPEHSSSFMPVAIHGPNLDVMHYPRVSETSEYYIIESTVGNLRHHLSTPALKEPMRVTLSMTSVGQRLEVTLKLFGKNLPKPYVKTMFIDVV